MVINDIEQALNIIKERIDVLPNVILKDKNDECDVFVSESLVFHVIDKYITDLKAREHMESKEN